jgi:hypothetical protein
MANETTPNIKITPNVNFSQYNLRNLLDSLQEMALTIPKFFFVAISCITFFVGVSSFIFYTYWEDSYKITLFFLLLLILFISVIAGLSIGFLVFVRWSIKDLQSVIEAVISLLKSILADIVVEKGETTFNVSSIKATDYAKILMEGCVIPSLENAIIKRARIFSYLIIKVVGFFISSATLNFAQQADEKTEHTIETAVVEGVTHPKAAALITHIERMNVTVSGFINTALKGVSFSLALSLGVSILFYVGIIVLLVNYLY